jgi:hypothetical protein
MKTTEKYLWCVFIVIVIGVVGYCVYSDYQEAGVYKDCVSVNSLDVQRQDQIELYCHEIARGE